ncbi:unnamed protein product [Arabis nemorensis]|uniref:Uncharacterized protein n=1 Tax=Arabis nemorensis TaxID=586526 RepID=A0A565CDL5_9BRAS|nr:unnamed protein product [Arabis nemorensis]
MSESARAQERLDFEAAAKAIEKGKAYKEVRQATEPPIDFLAGGLNFTSGGTEQIKDTGVVDMKSSKTYLKGKSSNGVLHLFCANVLISLILSWER